MRGILLFIVMVLIPSAALAQAIAQTGQVVHQTSYIGVSGLWILANFSYAGMVAQNNQSFGWRILAFIFGLPGTLLTWIVVKEGSERAYGVDIPKKKV